MRKMNTEGQEVVVFFPFSLPAVLSRSSFMWTANIFLTFSLPVLIPPRNHHSSSATNS